MSTAATRTPPVDLLELGVRRIRRVGAPDVPFAATRAVMGEDDDPVLLVDVASLDDWAGWHAAGAQHLLAPTDVLRGSDGHEVVLSDLRESCDRTFGVRDEAGAGWLRGEAVTLVVSMLRGMTEASARGLDDDGIVGEWWMTADGRPVFAFACGEAAGQTITAATGDSLRRIQVACEDRVIARIVDDALDALESPHTLQHRADQIETALFEAAAPQPIAASAARRAIVRPSRSIDIAHDAQDTILGRIRAAVERHVDTGVGESVAGALQSISAWHVRRSARENKPRHGRVVLIGLGAAAVVLAAGMLWPSGEGSDAQTSPESASSAPTASPSATPTPTVTAREAKQDPIEAASAILAEWASCGMDCEFAHGLERAGAVAAPDASIALVDDYGEVVLIEVSARDEGAQLMVLERADERWRIREVFDAP